MSSSWDARAQRLTNEGKKKIFTLPSGRGRLGDVLRKAIPTSRSNEGPQRAEKQAHVSGLQLHELPYAAQGEERPARSAAEALLRPGGRAKLSPVIKEI